ncbi:MAG: flagellar biosynthesis protein FlhF [Succinivibrio sp.]|nr:flagellar biosynthesis protein FlhF [Succinivibrio sp.]
MKLKRFVASDMREALSQIKNELGADAVIMSNKRVAGGVEIVAGIESESPAVSEASAPAAQSPQGPLTEAVRRSSGALGSYLKDDEVTLSENSKSRAVTDSPVLKTAAAGSGSSKSETFAKSLLEILERQQQERQKQEQASAQERAVSTARPAGKTPAAALKRPAPPQPLAERSGLRDLFEEREHKKAQERKAVEAAHGMSSYQTSEAEQGSLQEVKEQVAEIKKLLQFELAGLIKDSQTREQPVRAMTTSLLVSAGFAPEVAALLSGTLDKEASFNNAWRDLGDLIRTRLKVGSDEIIREGGIVALIGPAGVGKTTTLAKLAARFVMNYGPDGVAVVTADHYRIGAVEQIKTYGRIMGCTAFAVDQINDLKEVLYTLRDKSLVLVDTAGVGLKDERFNSQLNQLKQQSQLKLKHYLVLPATSQSRVLSQAYDHFADIGIEGMILTKMDESSSLGDALSLCLKHDLKLSYVTDGQRVPEDLKVPDAGELTQRALAVVESDAAQSAFGLN